jgi:hypothetical protein
VVSLGVGTAFDRLGPRRMFPLAALLLVIGFALSGQGVGTLILAPVAAHLIARFGDSVTAG